MVALQGSEKQVAWAEQIRTKAEEMARGRLAHELAHSTAHENDPYGPARLERRRIAAERLTVGLARFAEITDARWWIENRSRNGADLAIELGTEK